MAKPTVVLLPTWGTGHLMPMPMQRRRLLRFSLTVLVIPPPTPESTAEVADVVRREQAAAAGHDDDEIIRLHSLPVIEHPSNNQGMHDLISELVRLYVPHVRDAVAALSSPVAALVIDFFCTAVLDVSRELSIPTYVYFATNADAAPAEGGAVAVPGLPPVPWSSLPSALQDKTSMSYRWFMYHGGGARAGRAPTVYPTGPPHECVRWLETQPPASVVLLCFGSMGSFTPPQVLEMAQGIERSGQHFLWVLRGPPAAGKGLVWPATAPQKEIVAHAAIGGFVTQCGWNSVLKSLWFGVPMVPWPLYAEQHLNAFTLVTDIGVAVAMEMDRKRGNWPG
ncbi:hypothetical protein SETIT_8G091600v2 [Setaria italica]|uniref:UDP-glycosyltransferases domain-containing protein n=1 Tax=Setaria italica TaxID=4555 RepID=K3ZLB5_SETIT|nr:hypothetical protein SETIT_8G091600v2 [Setaria italica]